MLNISRHLEAGGFRGIGRQSADPKPSTVNRRHLESELDGAEEAGTGGSAAAEAPSTEEKAGAWPCSSIHSHHASWAFFVVVVAWGMMRAAPLMALSRGSGMLGVGGWG
jgi:hypothetical protein